MLSRFLRRTEPKEVRAFTAWLPPPMSRQVPVVELEYDVYYAFLPAIRVRRTKYRIGTTSACLLVCHGCGQIVIGYTEYDGTVDECLTQTAADIHAAIIMHHGYTPPSWKC